MGTVKYNKKPKSTYLSKTINSNSIYTWLPQDNDAEYFSGVRAYVDVQPTLQKLGLQYLRENNKVYKMSKTSEIYDGLDEFSVKTEIPMMQKTITQNGTYNPIDDDVEGYDSVIVELPQPETVDKYITENGVYDPAEDNVFGYAKIYVDVEGGGGEEKPYAKAKEHKIVIADYDGTEIYVGGGYEGDEITLPTPPAHDGLVFDRWICGEPIENNKIIVNKQDIVVMPTYHTASGKTEITFQIRHDDVKITTPSGSSFPTANVQVRPYFSGSQTVVIDWGDGSPLETYRPTTSYNFYHNYTDFDEHVMTIESTGTYYFTGMSFGNSTNDTSTNLAQNIKKVRLSDKCTSIRSTVFRYAKSMESISIPGNLDIQSTYSFGDCNSLKGLVIPKIAGSTAPGYICYDDYSLRYAAIDNSVKSLGQNIFYNCYALRNFSMPVDLISIGSYMFYYCNSLNDIYIPPAINVGSCASMFNYNRGITSLTISRETSMVPNAFTSYCTALKSIVFEGNITSIGTTAFSTCSSLIEIDLSNCSQIPTLSASAALTAGAPGNRKIYVPASLYDEWKAETNWSTAAIARQLVPVEGK